MKMKRITLISTVLLFSTFFAGSLLFQSTKTRASSEWEKVGIGNLKTITVNENTYLVSDKEDLTNEKGVRGSGYKTIAGIKPNKEKFLEQTTKEIPLEFDLLNGKQTVNNISINGSIVSSEVNWDRSPDGNKILFDVGEGIWVANSDGSQLKNIALKGLDSFDKRLEEFTSKPHHNENPEYTPNEFEPDDDHGMTPWWTHQPHWFGDSTIAFMSNRDVFPDGWYSSIWTMDINDLSVKKIIDGAEAKEELNLLFADDKNIIAFGGINRVVYKYNKESSTTQNFPINGVISSISNDGKYILFNGVDNNSTLKSTISILDSTTGKIFEVNHPNGYQIFGGSWSSDNLYFSFYSRATTGETTSLYLLDLISQSEKVIIPPAFVEPLNPLGAISWLNNSVIVTTNDNTSWKATIR